MQYRKTILNQNQRNFIGSTPPILKGITPEQLKSITEKRTQKQTQNVVKKMVRHVKKPSRSPGIQVPIPPRPTSKYLTTVEGKIKRMQVPEAGSFNPGLVGFDDGYIMVYRPNEYAFKACLLDKNLNIRPNSYFKFNITNCADPRLIWTDNRLVMVYSSTEEVGLRQECIRGSIIMDRNKSDNFIDSKPFDISLPSVSGRRKNWMPFRYENKVYLIGSISPHIIYEMNFLGNKVVCEKKFETAWYHPWFYKEFLRGNTNAIQLAGGNYLGTFHTAVKLGPSMHYYDNGCYVFEGKPPFKVLRCSNRTYLKAEDATSDHYRKKNLITVCFPVGMVSEGSRLLISYGDNDTDCKIIDTTIDEMLATTVEIY